MRFAKNYSLQTSLSLLNSSCPDVEVEGMAGCDLLGKSPEVYDVFLQAEFGDDGGEWFCGVEMLAEQQRRWYSGIRWVWGRIGQRSLWAVL